MESNIKSRWWHLRRYAENTVAVFVILLGLPLNVLLSIMGVSLSMDDGKPKGHMNAAIRHSLYCGLITLVVLVLIWWLM
jgi:ABC-type Fe3+ transport system permease subunit